MFMCFLLKAYSFTTSLSLKVQLSTVDMIYGPIDHLNYSPQSESGTKRLDIVSYKSTAI